MACYFLYMHPGGPIALFLILGAGFAYGLLRLRHAMRLRAAVAVPFPDPWNRLLQEQLPPYGSLTDEERSQLQRHMQRFIATKRFEGCGGLTATEEMKVLVAGQACLLLLNRDTRCYPRLKSVVLYPHTFTGGVGEGVARLGESWTHGTVVLAWNSVSGGVANFNDGRNVTLHEFAHQLDQEDGAADGLPAALERSAYASWARVLSGEYDRLRRRAAKGRKTVMDRYGASNPAEFFAVASETFFEKPDQLRRRRPELFDELLSFYKTDPRNWDT